jgi:hypothetical protein
MSSIDLIEIDEGSDPKIEDFLVREDPKFQDSRREVIVPTESYDFMKKFPPCLKGKEGLSGIRKYLKQTVSKTNAPLVDYDLHRSTISPVQSDGCFHWVENYYTDIPLL